MDTVDRRTLLRAGLAAGGAGLLAAACGRDRQDQGSGFVTPDGEEVRTAEAARNPGQVRAVRLSAVAGAVDLGGPSVATWSYDGQVPGAPIRASAGEVLCVTLANELPAETSIHWHGIALRNDADGVPGLTQPPVAPGSEFTYEFTLPHPGTYWFHPHTGTQLDRGLYAPLIVDDPAEPGGYDDEWTVMLDDWLDGVAGTPDDVLEQLRGGMDHAMMAGQTSALLGGDAGDVRYPHFLLNGRVPAAPETIEAAPGSRLRLRIINAGGDTAFRVALGGHRLTVTHTDGFPVEPVDTDALLVGMGERYDVLVTLGDGVFPLIALAEGKDDAALGLVRTGSGTAPGPDVRPAELDGRVVSYRRLAASPPARLADRPPDRTVAMEITGGMMAYDWGFNGRRFDHANTTGHIEPIQAGERVRLALTNTTTMWHPLHLHGHTFAVADSGVRKDTANVLPGRMLEVDFDADNPGLWMLHCHNVYHAEAGMMTVLGYQR
jgi:FtsP/CotA-like multicopper oxidase with cupredoxin domain